MSGAIGQPMKTLCQSHPQLRPQMIHAAHGMPCVMPHVLALQCILMHTYRAQNYHPSHPTPVTTAHPSPAQPVSMMWLLHFDMCGGVANPNGANDCPISSAYIAVFG